MGKSSSVEAALDRLIALRADQSAPGVRDELARALASKTYLLAAKAAQLAGEFKRTDLTAELVGAFDRFLTNPDQGCSAKTAVAKTLYEVGDRDAEPVFVRGIRHVQKEGSFGPPVDVAAELRGTCALGLVKIGYRDVLVELTDLLDDPEPQARVGAARALAYAGQDAGALLLRLKLLMGDPNPDVAAECMTALLNLWPRKALAFVARFLDDVDDSIRGYAALALGESRQAEALEPLRARFKRESEPDVRRVILVAVATLRSPESVEHLLSVIASARSPDAIAALEALGIYRHDAAIRTKVDEVVKKRGDEALQRSFAKSFPS
jgi:HEAT repeat protein